MIHGGGGGAEKRECKDGGREAEGGQSEPISQDDDFKNQWTN